MYQNNNQKDDVHVYIHYNDIYAKVVLSHVKLDYR